MKQIILAISFAFMISCHGKNNGNPSNYILKDTIKTKHFKEIISQDSIVILQFKKFNQDTFNDERIVYIDLKRNNSDKTRLINYKTSDFLIKINESRADNNDFNRPDSLVINNFDIIKNTFIDVEKYKNDYCLDFFNKEFTSTINDTSVIFNFMDGYYVCYFKSITFENNIYKIDLVDNVSKIKNISIKIIDKVKQIQIWRVDQQITDSDSSYAYELKVPISKIIDLPILYIMFSGGLDNSSEFYDNLDLEKLYNK